MVGRTLGASEAASGPGRREEEAGQRLERAGRGHQLVVVYEGRAVRGAGVEDV